MDRELVTTIEPEVAAPIRVLLKPRYTPARTGPTFQCLCTESDLPAVIEAFSTSQFLALDFETRGNDPSNSIEIAGVGLAWDTGSVYFHYQPLSPPARDALLSAVLNHPRLLAHNAYFDGGVLRVVTGYHGQFAACTLALYMYLSNEGWAGQTWGLKDAMQDILLWKDTNERDLDEWLCLQGLYKGTRLADDSPEHRREMFELGKIRPDKAEMWQAPSDILGKYCVLDADACYLLYTEHLLPTAQQFGEPFERFIREFMGHIELHIDQKLHGLVVDTDLLAERLQSLGSEISRRDMELRSHPAVSSHIREIETELLAPLAAKEPDRYLRQRVRPEEPPHLKKDGTVSKTWLKWVENGDKYTVPVQSGNWVNWQERWQKAVAGENPAYKFNPNSNQQVIELLYNRLGNPVRQTSEKSGDPSTSIKAMKQMGEIGGLFVELAYAQKEMGFIEDYTERTQHRTTIHPSFRLPGTKTGRLSSKQPNLQQVPKSKTMMSLFRARPGHVLVDLDFAALEAVVAAELSQDPNLLEIYGDGKPENDIHLFLASHVTGLKEPILAAGYRPYNPPAGSVSKAKKAGKAERGKAKTVVYACQFGAGVDKVIETLEKDDIYLPYEEVELIHSTYWDLFQRLKQYSWDLQRLWRRNGGYVLNGLGRPMCLLPDYKHDVLNRVIQSTGHDILVRYVAILTGLLRERGIHFMPWVIDLHDATTVEVPEEFRDVCVQAFHDAMYILNRDLGGTIQLRGTPESGYTMADVKQPEE